MARPLVPGSASALPPGQGGMVEQLHETDRNMDQRVPVAPTGLDQYDTRGGILGEPVGEHATRRASADNDVIGLHVHPSLTVSVIAWSLCASQPPAAHAASFCRASSRIIAAPFSAIMMVGALVLVEVTVAITE